MKLNGSATLIFPNRRVINIFSWIFVGSSLIGAFTSTGSVIQGLRSVITIESYGLDTYQGMLDSVESSGHIIRNVPFVIMNAMYSFAALLLFVNMTYEKKNKLLIGLIAFFLLYGAIKYISIGERGGLVNRSLVVLISYISMKGFLSETINKKIKKVGLVVAVIVTIPFMALTVSRFADTEYGTKNSLFIYAGQGNLNFCRYALDDNGIRYGDRTVSLIKRIIGIPNTPHNYLERRMKYPNLKINDEVFSTFVGDFAIDFGPIVAMLIFIIISILLTQMVLTNRNLIWFHSFIILHFIMCVLVQGVTLFQYADSGNLTIIFYLFLYFYLKNGKVYPIATINTVSDKKHND